MGNVSSGTTNDDLVDGLVEMQYLTKNNIEQIFRAVDRDDFYLNIDAFASNPYSDSAWKVGNIHMSAPCIYTQVLENIDLQRGMSFLNLGSGTGYLSALAGLILGHTGINHGIEIYEDVIEFANERLAKFMLNSEALDKYEFCCPKYVLGNCLQLPETVQYDRVYCGAACLDNQVLEYLKHLIKVGGILITPMDSELMIYKRVEDKVWEQESLLPVAFSNLLPAEPPYRIEPVLPAAKVMTLEELCILVVRDRLRKKVYAENEKLGEEETSAINSKRMNNKRKASDYNDSDSDSRYSLQISRYSTDSDRYMLKVLRLRTNAENSSNEENIENEVNNDNVTEVPHKCEEHESSESEADHEMNAINVPPSFSELLLDKIKLLVLPKPMLVNLNRGKYF